MTGIGLLLAAGAGSRMGRPKALVHDERGSWLRRAVGTLHEGGCASVVVVLGASADAAEALLSDVDGVEVVVCEAWAEGLSASLRTGLDACAASHPTAEAAVVLLVDLPDVTADVVRRLSEGMGSATPVAGTLRRATYAGTPGHPVVIGRDHWAAVAAEATGDRGAGPYLRAHGAVAVECGDLATGDDVDRPPPR